MAGKAHRCLLAESAADFAHSIDVGKFAFPCSLTTLQGVQQADRCCSAREQLQLKLELSATGVLLKDT